MMNVDEDEGHEVEAAADRGVAGALQTCLMIGETTDGANCLTYLRHRR